MPIPRGQDGDPEEFFSKKNGHADLCNVPHLSKDAILTNLRKRFKDEIVYTYVGDIIVSVNPFCNTGSVGKGIRKRYKNLKNPASLPPHIYALVDATYGLLMESMGSQSILISGESGAGKTEACKLCLLALAELSQSTGSATDEALESAVLLETFGNAKTVYNDNSSRFGKW